MFFSFDGIDGVGKIDANGFVLPVAARTRGTTSSLAAIRAARRWASEFARSCSIATSVRRSAAAREMLLYMAARAQLVDEVIRPALAAGKTVVSDRYLLANIVYQGHAGGLDLEAIRQVGAVAVDGICPDAVFLLDMSPAAADARLRRSLDRMESQGADYRERLRAGFLAEAAARTGESHPRDRRRPPDRVRTGRDSWDRGKTARCQRPRMTDCPRVRISSRHSPHTARLRALGVLASAGVKARYQRWQRVIDGYLRKL